MIDRHRQKCAADNILAAALTGKGWKQPLSTFARAAGARDAVLMRNSSERMLAAEVTDQAAESVAAFAAGKAPPNSRYKRVRTRVGTGFRGDLDDYMRQELCTDPFYQEFLRPAGLFWHGNAVLESCAGEEVELSLKRSVASGPYDRQDLTALDSVLPQLTAAIRYRVEILEAQARGALGILASRGAVLFRLGRLGRIVGQEGDVRKAATPVDIVRGRLVARDRQRQLALDRAVFAAVDASRPEHGLVLLDEADKKYLLQLIPLPGDGRDLFAATTAIAVLIERPPRQEIRPSRSRPLALAFGLTERETAVVCLLAEGHRVQAISTILGLSQDTVRTYLKFAYDKLGVTHQSELAALVNRVLE